jgi:hypothetical protein
MEIATNIIIWSDFIHLTYFYHPTYPDITHPLIIEPFAFNSFKGAKIGQTYQNNK